MLFVIICDSGHRKLIPETRTALMVTTDAGRSVQIEPGPGWQKRGLQGSVRLEREVATKQLKGLAFPPKLKCDLPYLSSHSSPPGPCPHPPHPPPLRALASALQFLTFTHKSRDFVLSPVSRYCLYLCLCLRGPHPRTGAPAVHLQV